MENDVFCQIVKAEIPAYKVWEDENFLAFLDVNPKSPGHTLVIPKQHHRWVWEVSNFGEYFEKVKIVEKKLEKALSPEFVEMRVFGMDVPHAHVQLIPYYKEGQEVSFESLAEIAEKIRISAE